MLLYWNARNVDGTAHFRHTSALERLHRGRRTLTTMRPFAMRLLGLVIGALVILASAISFAAPDLRLSLEHLVITPAGLTRSPP